MKPFGWINAAWVLAIILGLAGASCTTQVSTNLRSSAPDPQPLTAKESDAVTQARVQAAYGKLPLHFEPNQGQTDEQVKFLSRGSGYTLFLTPTEAVLSLYKPRKDTLAPVSGERVRVRGSNPEQTNLAKPETQNSQLDTVLRMHLVGANPNPQVEGLEELPGKSNYFIGNDPKKWRTNIPTYARVRYQNVYPGIDLVYYGNQRQLEHDFIIAPGADPKAIRLAFDGLTPSPLAGEGQDGGRSRLPLQIDAQGDLILQTAGGEVRLHKPLIYQEINGVKQPIPGSYVLLSPQSSSLITFDVAAYDTSKPLIIDPVLDSSTYLGGSSSDSGSDIAVDDSGRIAYVTGSTSSINFPPNPVNPFGGGRDAFVVKLNAFAAFFLYTTYLGGSDDDSGSGIDDGFSGEVYVTGNTRSANFPTLMGFDTTYNGGTFGDAFVTKLKADGTIEFSTLLGGSGDDFGSGIVFQWGFGFSIDRVTVTGSTSSTDFPTQNPMTYPPANPCSGGALCGSRDAFVTGLSADLSALTFSTYLGGGFTEDGLGIATDGLNALVTGQTCSDNFPTENPYQGTHQGGCDAFVASLNESGGLTYSTYLGGTGWDLARGIFLDSHSNIYVTGETTSTTGFPTQNAFQGQHGGGTYDAFVTKLDPSQVGPNQLVYSTFLGGSGDDYGSGVAVDPSGAFYVTGNTLSANFPKENPLPEGATFSGGTSFGDAFVTKFKPSGSGLLYSTYLGGSGDDIGGDIAVDLCGAFVTGATDSPNFPLKNALQGQPGGGTDAFVTRIITEAPAATYFVDQYHPSASDDNPGTEQYPWKTIGHAAKTVVAGSTVFVKSGIYRETVVVCHSGTSDMPITFAAHPNSKVIITGADPVQAKWIPVQPGVYYAEGWSYTFAPEDQKRIEETRRQVQIPGVDKALVNEWLRTDLDEKQVFVDNDPPLAQVFDLKDMVPGTFFVDPKDGNKLYVQLKDGSNPAMHVIEASIRTQIFVIDHKHYIQIRGFTMQRAANNAAGLHAVLLGGDFIHFEENSVLEMSGLGLSLSEYQGYKLINNRMNHNGGMGAAGDIGKEALFIGNETSFNGFRWMRIFEECLKDPESPQDPESNQTCSSAIGWQHGGMKILGVDSATIKNHQAVGNIYHGIWLDVGGDNQILDSKFSDNGGDGIRLEAAHNTEVAGNRVVVSKNPVFQPSPTQYGIDITANNCSVHHNVIITSQKFSYGVFIFDGSPETSEGNKIYNNTIVNQNQTSIFAAIAASTKKPNEIKNNIFAHFPEGIRITYAANPSIITQEYNDFWEIQSKVVWSPDPSQPYVSVPPGQGSLFVDPLFVDEAGGNFQLQPDSPVIDKGTPVGLPFCGDNPDMGADERCGSVVIPELGGEIVDSCVPCSPGPPPVFSVGPDILPITVNVFIDVLPDPGVSPPPGFVGPTTSFVDFTLDPNPGTLPAPGATIVLPLAFSLPAETQLDLFEFDPPSKSLTPRGIKGTVDPDGATATFSGITQFSVFVGFQAVPEPASVPFDDFDIEVEIKEEEFEVKGTFTLGEGSDGINPLDEEVSFQVGTFATTIPAGSFKRDEEGEFKFEGVIDGVDLEVKIESLGGGGYEFKVEGEGVDLTGIVNPVEVTLTIGDDTGTASPIAELDDDDDDKEDEDKDDDDDKDKDKDD